MRQVLAHISEVCHFWANKVQQSGRAGNVYFHGERIYSYGAHYCIARHIGDGVVAISTRGYSSSTASHTREVESASRHLQKVYCHDAGDYAEQNMRAARSAIGDALANATRKGIRQTTRDRLTAEALRLAEQANAYLAALPETDSANIAPIDTAPLVEANVGAAARAEKYAAAQDAMRAEREAAYRARLQSSLVEWRAHRVLISTGLANLPVALRLSQDGATIESSYGARIPSSGALWLWSTIGEVMASGKAYAPSRRLAVGDYRLDQIRADGSITVGCHDIPYSEIAAIAAALGFAQHSVEAQA